MSAVQSDWAQIVELLLRNEKALMDPEVRRNREHMSQYLAADFREFGSSGKVWSRGQILDLSATGPIVPPQIEAFDCQKLAEGVALVTYRAVRTDPQSNQRTTTLRSSLWLIKSGQWRIRFHQGTHVPRAS